MNRDAPNRSSQSNRSSLVEGHLAKRKPVGNPAKASRCIAQTRHGSWCQRPAMRNLLRFGASLLIGLILNFRN
jgi:hypothetical protein